MPRAGLPPLASFALLASCALLASFALLWAPRAASAQALEAAQRAEDDGRLVDAHAAYTHALEAGGLDASETARAHLRLGVLTRAVGGDEADARAHLQQAFAIDPEAEPPPELSPDARAALEQLRGDAYRFELSAAAERAAVDATRGPDPAGSPMQLRLLGPAGAASFRVELGGAARELRPTEGVAALLVPTSVTSVVATALDGYGNALHVETLEVQHLDLTVRGDPARPNPLAVDCPTSADPCDAPAACRPAGTSCEPRDDSGLSIGLGVGAAVLIAAAAIVASVLAVDAYDTSLWRVDQAGTR